MIRLVLVVGLLVLLPGWLLVNAAFPGPRSRVRGIERAYLTVAAGILVLTSVGLILGFLPGDGRGYFQTAATGFPHAEFAMVLVMGLLFYVGLMRGAYPGVAARFPKLVAGTSRPKSPQSR